MVLKKRFLIFLLALLFLLPTVYAATCANTEEASATTLPWPSGKYQWTTVCSSPQGSNVYYKVTIPSGYNNKVDYRIMCSGGDGESCVPVTYYNKGGGWTQCSRSDLCSDISVSSGETLTFKTEFSVNCWGSGCDGNANFEAVILFCGDTYCGIGETCSSCSNDCGSCGGTPSPYCGDGNCDSGETCGSCSSDCGGCSEEPSAYCGDGSCNGEETCGSCSSDCGACAQAKRDPGDVCDEHSDCKEGLWCDWMGGGIKKEIGAVCCKSGEKCCDHFGGYWTFDGVEEVCGPDYYYVPSSQVTTLCKPCTYNSECDFNYCTEISTGGKVCAVADTTTWACCANGRFLRNWNKGSSCCVDADCNSGYVCGKSYYCVEKSLVTTGTKKSCQECSSNSDCESNRCTEIWHEGRYMNVCMPDAGGSCCPGEIYVTEGFNHEIGSGCCNNSNCPSNAECVNNKCVKKEGASQAESEAKKYTPEIAKNIGDSCTSNSQCISGYCKNNVCAKKGGLDISFGKKEQSEFLQKFYSTYDLAPRYRDGKQIHRSAMYNGYYYFYKEQAEQIDLPVATLGKFTIILDDFKALAMDVVSLNPISIIIDLKSFADDIDAKISSDTGPVVNIMINAYSIGSLGLDIARKSAKVDTAISKLTSNFPSNKVTRAISSRQEALRKKIAPTEEVENQLFVLSIADFVMEKTLISDVRQTFDFSIVDYSMKIQLSIMARELSKLYLKAEARTLTEQEAIILMILEHDFWSMVAARQENFITNENEAGIFKKSWNQVVQKLLLYDHETDVLAAENIASYAKDFLTSIDASRKELFEGAGK